MIMMMEEPKLEHIHHSSRPAAKMIISSISNRKLHFYFLLFILFIVIILSLPLLLIREENEHSREHQVEIDKTSGMQGILDRDESAAASAATNNQTQQQLESSPVSPASASAGQTTNGSTPITAVNCTQFALDNNLTLANEDCK